MDADSSKPKLKLSKHFIARWKERFGREPSLRKVRKLIREAVWLQRSHDMRYPSGAPYRTLSIYVDFERQIAIKVDEIQGVVVTMVWPGKREKDPHAKAQSREGVNGEETTPQRKVYAVQRV